MHFILIQSSDIIGTSEADYENIAAIGSEVISFGLPNPLIHEFDNLTLSPGEKAAKLKADIDELKRRYPELGGQE